MLRLALLLAFFAAAPAFADDSAVVGRASVRADFAYGGGGIKVLVLDADQTLRISSSKWRAPRHPSEVILLPGVKDKIAEYERNGYFVAIISNQHNAVNDTGLGEIDSTMRETIRQLQAGGAKIDYYDFSLEPQEAKPATAMFDRLAAALKTRFGADIDRAHSLFVGDAAYLASEKRPDGRMGFDTANFDRLFAENNHVPYQEPQDFFGWKKNGVDRIQSVAELQAYREKAAGPRGPGSCEELFKALPLAP